MRPHFFIRAIGRAQDRRAMQGDRREIGTAAGEISAVKIQPAARRKRQTERLAID